MQRQVGEEINIEECEHKEEAVLEAGGDGYLYLPVLIPGGQENIITLMEEDQNERGDGGDSDEEGGIANEHDISLEHALRDRAETMITLNDDSNSYAIDMTGVQLPPDLNIPGTPDNWTVPPRKVNKGEPIFTDVDNPGDWSDFVFRPQFKKNGQYERHTLPTGATPVKMQTNGKREVSGWEFFYKGWNSGSSDYRSGACSNDMFPDSRKGCLDAELLRRLGLTGARMEKCDALFFYQLILPICDPERSGIDNDPRKAFYSEVEKCTTVYAADLGLFGSYGHDFKSVQVPELVAFDGVVVRDGVKGCSDGAIYRRWSEGADFDHQIFDAITFSRWLQIKRVIKLNNNSRDPQCGEPGYNPAYKFDMLYNVIISNTNALSKYAELDQTGDETTWGHGGFGESGSGLVGRIVGKPGVTKGGQIVLVSDVHRIRPRAYIHRHTCYEKPPGWTVMGQLEVRMLMEKIGSMVLGEDSTKKKIFREKPHSTWDNYFSGDKIFDYLGANGYAATMTNRRDRLPSDVPGEYFQKKKTDSGRRSKAARFLNPITAVKTVDATAETKAYRRVHCSFQSTSSCNISTVNALNSNSVYIRKRQRGKGNNKRFWGIEMNEARQLYLSTYSRIDSMDHMIKNASMFYRSWKYWHAPMLHGKALAVVIAFDMYLEIAEGKLDESWKVNNTVKFWRFRELLSEQMLQYNPIDRKYPGDDKMRVCTQKKKRARSTSRSRSPFRDGKESEQEAVTREQLAEAKRGGKGSRLCGNMSKFTYHVNSIEKIRSEKICYWCGGPAYTICQICEVPLHYGPKKGAHAGKQCFLHYHDESMFGLGRGDCSLLNTSKKDWQSPTRSRCARNRAHITTLGSR